MQYNIDWVEKRFDSGQKNKYLFFWGHRPNRDGSIGNSCFSQWWKSSFEKDGMVFKTAEHWMMYQKAILFEDQEIAKQILRVKTPGEAKKLGRKVRGFTQEAWEENRSKIVVEGNQLKFEQHSDLKTYLMNTGERILVEASPYDNIWGIGLTKDAKNIQNPHTWKGINLLGFALMEVRDLFRQ